MAKQPIKTQIIKVRVTQDEKVAFDAAAKARNTTASKLIRAAIGRVVKKHVATDGVSQ